MIARYARYNAWMLDWIIEPIIQSNKDRPNIVGDQKVKPSENPSQERAKP